MGKVMNAGGVIHVLSLFQDLQRRLAVNAIGN